MIKIQRTPRAAIRHVLLLSGLMLGQHVYAADCSNLAAWSSATAYNGGAQVQYQNLAYRANWWTQGDIPAEFSGPWQQWTNLGQCDNVDPNPQVSVTSPVDGSVLAENDNVVITADASSPNGNITQVSFEIDGQEVAVDTQSPWSADWTATLGVHTVTAKATDSTGATAIANIGIEVKAVVDNKPPTADLTNPTAASIISAGDSVMLSAEATDADGLVNLVAFYVDDVKVGSAVDSPYQVPWTATAGLHSFKVVATDDKGAQTTSAVVSVSVSGGSGGCVGVPQYQAGTSYAANDVVENQNHKYQCDVAGWCSSNAAWAYEPGVGQHWTDAWTDLGVCAIVPEVAITSPADNALLPQGKAVSLSADASDTDGVVAQVEFFAAGKLLATDTSAPYNINWNASELGEVQLKAVATDNEGNAGTATILVNVTDQTLLANLTSPASGTVVSLGKSVALAADASSLDNTVNKVEFLVNGASVASDPTSPYTANWTPGAAGDYSVNAKVTDSTGATANSAAVTVKVVDVPTGQVHQLIGYWHNFINGAGCPMPLRDISSKWDVVDIAFADNDRNSNGTVHFNLFAGKAGCPAIDPAQFKQDIAALKAQGKKVVLSLGGAEGTITLNTDSDETNFVASLTDIINEWGFSGLDIDLESGSNLVHGSQIQLRLPGALKAIEANIGGDMYLTMAPEHPYVHGGMIAYSGIWGAYIPLIHQLRDTLDLLHVQLYNNSGLPNPYMSGAAPEGSVDMMVASAKMLVEGFELADGSRFEPLRDDQVAIGLPSGPSSANSGQAPTQNIIDALDCLTKGTRCSSVVPASNYRNFGGVMTWSINWDAHDGFNFSGPIGDKIDAMNTQR